MLIFLDAETTGVELEDKICSIAVLYEENKQFKFTYEVVNEGKKISPQASSVNHITNEMIKSSVAFKDSSIYTFLQEHNNVEVTIVGHNVNHTMQKLTEVGFVFKGATIDTQRVSKHLIQECESYALQFLRYELKLYKAEPAILEKLDFKENLFAHHALSDSIIVYLLYMYLLDLVSTDEMNTLSFKNVLIEKFEFGKYKGRYIEEIYDNDRAYLNWMILNMDLDDDLRYSINYYLEG